MTEVKELVFHDKGKLHTIDKGMSCYEEVVLSIMNILITSDDTFDMITSPEQMEEFRREKSWVEIIFKDDTSLMVGYVNQIMAIRKILIIFKNKKPLYIFFGTPSYLGDTNLAANTKANTSLYDLLETCTIMPE